MQSYNRDITAVAPGGWNTGRFPSLQQSLASTASLAHPMAVQPTGRITDGAAWQDSAAGLFARRRPLGRGRREVYSPGQVRPPRVAE